MACLWRDCRAHGGGVGGQDWALLTILGVQAMVESQRSRLTSLLQAGAFPALSSILTPT